MFDERLVVVGTGIRTVGQLTMESVAWIRRADKVLYIVSDPIAEDMIKKLNPQGHESLYTLYAENKPRIETYNAMIDKTLGYVREGKVVCMAAYGHPGVFAYPTHESVRRARAEGYQARMLPGVSAEDCLFADIGIDPGMSGCQTFEATDFLVNGRYLDPSTHVVLWQIGVLGDATFKRAGYDIKGMPQLLAKLFAHGYTPQHPVCVYEAPIFPGIEPVMKWIQLQQLPASGISAISTLYIPPATGPRTDASLVQALGLQIPTQSTDGRLH